MQNPTAAPRRRDGGTTIDRFFAKVDPPDANGCWLWNNTTFRTGYGQFFIGRKSVSAHRFSYEVAHGVVVPRGLDVCHTCDVRACVNPAHLWVGTRKENMQDMKAKGRTAHGSRHPRALPDATVQAIRAMRQDGATMSSIANHFGVSSSTVSRLTHGQRHALLSWERT